MFESSSNGKRDRDEEAMMGDGDDLESDLGEEKAKKKLLAQEEKAKRTKKGGRSTKGALYADPEPVSDVGADDGAP